MRAQEISSGIRISPRHTARILGGQNPERKTPFLFSKQISPPPNQKCKECFSFGVAAAPARRWRGFRRAYDLGQSHHALPAWDVSQESAGRKAAVFGINDPPRGG